MLLSKEMLIEAFNEAQDSKQMNIAYSFIERMKYNTWYSYIELDSIDLINYINDNWEQRAGFIFNDDESEVMKVQGNNIGYIS